MCIVIFHGTVDIIAKLLWKLMRVVFIFCLKNTVVTSIFFSKCLTVSCVDTRGVIRGDWLYSLLSLFHPLPEGGRKEPQIPDCSEGDIVQKGQWVNQGYPISNNPQTFRNAERSAAADWPRGCCHMTPWPPPAVWGTSHLCQADKRTNRR